MTKKIVQYLPWITAVILIVVFLFTYPNQLVTVDEVSYVGISELILTEGSIRTSNCTPGAGDGLWEIAGTNDCVYKYNIGTSIIMLPAVAISPSLAFIFSFTMLLGGAYLFSKILEQLHLDIRYTVLYLCYPAFVFYSRTAMSEIYSVFLITLIIFLLLNLNERAWNYLLLAIVITLAVLTRYTLVLPLALMLLLFGWQNRHDLLGNARDRAGLTMLVTATLVGAVITMLINSYAYGSPLASGYTLSGEQTISSAHFAIQLIGYLSVLNVVYPGMLHSGFSMWKKHSWLLIPALMYIGFYLFSPNTLFEFQVTDLVIGIRFIVPIIPLLLIGYISWLDQLKLLELARAVKYLIVVGLVGSATLIQVAQYLVLQS